MPVILARAGKRAVKLDRTVIQDESYLQRYIYENPDCLPLDQFQEDVRPIVLAREFPTSSGPIDALAVDQHGNIYLIETKLYKNPDKRTVIAQVLDYGAALWKAYPDPDTFVSRLDLLLQQRGRHNLVELAAQTYGLEGQAISDFIDNMKGTISSGRFRFVVLMDTLDDRLKDLIAFMNTNSAFDVLGVGLDFYHHEDIDILIPTLHSPELKKSLGSASTGGRQAWDEQRFFSDASSRLSPDHLRGLKELYEWATANADDIPFGTGGKSGSFNPKFAAVSPKSVFTAKSDGGLAVNFGWLGQPESTRLWRDRFGELLIREGFPIPSNFHDRFVSLPATEWVPRISKFLEVISSQVAEARGAA